MHVFSNKKKRKKKKQQYIINEQINKSNYLRILTWKNWGMIGLHIIMRTES